jgi:hypothetical protein
MARLISLFPFIGTIGDKTGYKRHGEHFIRQKSSLSGDRVRKDPAFASSQVRAAEYGGASTIASHLRKGLGPLQHIFLSGRVHPFLLKAVRKGLLPGGTENGPADFSMLRATHYLPGVQLSASSKPLSLDRYPPHISTTSKAAGFSLSITPPPFPVNQDGTPGGATHCAFVVYVQPFTDYRFNKKESRYQPAAKTKATPHTHRFSWISVDQPAFDTSKPPGKAKPETFTVNLGKPQKGVYYLVWWGILFTQKIGNEHVALLSGTNLKLETTISTSTLPAPVIETPARETITPHLKALQDIFGISRIT